MKISIVFDSITGNTKMIANAIKEVCGDDVVYFGEPNKIEPCDLIFVGTWIDKGNCSKKIRDFINTLNNQNIALFATAGFGGSPEYFDSLSKRIDAICGNNKVLGHYFCQGKMPISVKERYIKMIQANPEDRKLQVSLTNFDEALTHPNDDDIKKAKQFTLDIIKK